MNPQFSIILKNAILLLLLIFSGVFIFTQQIGFKEFNYVFISLGCMYVVASCYEALKLSQTKKDAFRFRYFTDSFVAKRLIKIILFACVGIILYYSHSLIKYLSFLCFLIAFTEIIVTVWRYIKQLCFVALEDSLLIISTNKVICMRASEISKIEFRHGLIYFIDNSQKSITLRHDLMKEKEAFKSALEKWITKNALQDKVLAS